MFFILRVAVCDDDGASREALLDILRAGSPGQKYSVWEYPDGEKLLFEYAENPQPFDLILLDLQMPVLDGVETAIQIRRIDRDVPIIIVTKHAEYTVWGYDIHAWHYLLKPVNAEKLRGALHEIAEARERKKKTALRYKREPFISEYPLTESSILKADVIMFTSTLSICASR